MRNRESNTDGTDGSIEHSKETIGAGSSIVLCLKGVGGGRLLFPWVWGTQDGKHQAFGYNKLFQAQDTRHSILQRPSLVREKFTLRHY